MNEFKARAQVLTREEAIRRAAWQIREVRKKAAELYGWVLAGEADSYLTPYLRVRDMEEALQSVLALASAFSDVLNYDATMTAFLEEARLEAARRAAEAEEVR
ncbi:MULTISPECIES: hypothetical protein [Thermus]|uniref:hypothetical protein n=1 Tax=Thermus thalpophilus TaxID=2908147 RepID=UPI001FA9920C|nr:hypothetical protein [Thermus thalpophilus]